jgi:CheY-like chemotaxis protein
VTFLAYYGELIRFLMRCDCGQSFVLTMSEATSERQRGAHAHPRALVVDPHEDTRELYRAALTLGGLEASVAATVKKALENTLDWHPEVIATELRLPDGDGLEMCRTLKRSPEFAEIPIVVVTGETRARRLAEASRFAESVLTKPCPPDTYVTEMLRVVAGHRRNHS